MTGAAASEFETRTIYPIPLDQRHGRSWDLFTVWFGSNLNITTIATGALGPALFKLDFTNALVSALLGNVVGGIFMALHAAQGPRLGVPQMVQTRGQFGSYGAVIVIMIVVLMYLGFFSANLVLGGEALHSIMPAIGTDLHIVALCVLGVVAAIFGHNLIHAFSKFISLFAGLALIVCALWIGLVHGVPAGFLTKGGFTLAGFLGNVSVGALWQIAYAPYVSDYSRYMPPDTGARDAFWASYAGTVLSSVLTMLLGIALANLVPGLDAVSAIAAVMGSLAYVIIPIFILGLACACSINIYCATLSTITLVQTFLPNWRPEAKARVITTCILAGLALATALLSAPNFMESYENFLTILMYILVPWTAINLVDYYLVKHGEYDVPAFFLQDGGIYGRFNWPAIICYVIGVLIQMPFIATSFYTGPIAVALGGVDVSWLVGLAAIGSLYWTIVRATISRTACAG